MLLGWAKLDLAADEVRTGVPLSLRAQDLEMWDAARQRYVVEPGQFQLAVGQWSTDPAMLLRSVTVV